MLTSQQCQTLLTNMGPVIEDAFYGAYADTPDVLPALFDAQATIKTQEKFSGSTTLGLMEVFTNVRNLDEVAQLWDKTISWTEFDKTIQIPRTFLDDIDVNRSEIIKRARDLGRSAGRTKQYLATMAYTEADNTSFTYGATTFDLTTPDGQPMFSASHPYSKTDALTQSNYFTDAFSYTNLKAARIAMAQLKDTKHLPSAIIPDRLVYGPAIADVVAEVLNTTRGNPENAQNTVNLASGRGFFPRGLQAVENPFITDGSWFLQDSTMIQDSCIWRDRYADQLEDDYVFNNRVYQRAVHSRYGFGFIDWHCCQGHFHA